MNLILHVHALVDVDCARAEMSRNTTNRLESNLGHLHGIRGLQQSKVIGEWHFVKSVYAFHLWRVKQMNFLAEVYLICGFCQG